MKNDLRVLSFTVAFLIGILLIGLVVRVAVAVFLFVLFE